MWKLARSEWGTLMHCTNADFPLAALYCVRSKSLQLCLTFCNLMDCSLPGSSVCEILQARILENPRDGGAWWAAIYGVAESDTTEVT